MSYREASSWFCPFAPLATSTPSAATARSVKLYRFFRPTISVSINGPADSTCSYSRRWYNPLRRRRLHRPPPPDITRHWVEADETFPTSQERFVVVSYNILGDRNASKHRDLYQNIPSTDMKWDQRKRLICEELFGLNPDVICLQEVDRYFDLLDYMEKAGYVGSYKRRTGDTVDGCAMFWKADKFRLVAGESIRFREYGLRDNVAQLNVLEMCKTVRRRLLIGNVHVLYNPSRGDVKLGQIRNLLSKAHILSGKWGNIPIVLAGDYNSCPQSPIYEFLSSSELNILSHDRRELSGQRKCHPAQVFGGKEEPGGDPLFFMESFFKSSWTEDEIKVATGNAKSQVVLHPLKLHSSYATVTGSARTRDFNGEPLATSYHSKFFGTVDYLWYSYDLVATRVLDTLPVDVLQETGGLPCKKLGSDHLALVSEFAFVPTEENDVNNTA